MKDRRDGRSGPGRPDPPQNGGAAGGSGLPDSQDPESIDPGAPIGFLESLEDPTSAGFAGHVRSRINRRILAVQTVDFACTTLSGVFRTYVDLIFETLGSRNGNDRPKNDRKR